MLEPKRIEASVKPSIIEKLGNGTYYYNYDIKSQVVDVEQTQETRWTYIQAHLRGVPSYAVCVRGVIRQFVTAEDELSLINKYNAYQMGVINDSSICTEYQEYVGLVSSIKSNVKKDFDIQEADTKYDLLPTQADIVNLLKILVSTTTLTDTQALSCKSLYPTWESCIGKSLTTNDKVTYKGTLYKVIQTVNPVLEHQTPDLVPANYNVINEENKGTEDDPIPYVKPMVVYEGKYYTYEGVKYKCTRDSGNALQYTPDQLIGNYFERVELLQVMAASKASTVSSETIIDFVPPMSIEKGKLYKENGIIYECIQTSKLPISNKLSDLVGYYVEIV